VPATKPNASVLGFMFTTTEALIPATYTVQKFPGIDVIEYGTFGPECVVTNVETATAGSVTVTQASNTEIDGTFDVTLGTDQITGSFAAPTCATTPLIGPLPAGAGDGGTCP
jgi:hypothetical protein